ncbi:MAG: DUF4234 domain-containing protein [Clostridia bacterium]|nr:DUF4234 domain-containing protein [Clostridia bacterium]MBQ8859408.1 DUF4234 domain-containing protein [Clostridia bacterium]
MKRIKTDRSLVMYILLSIVTCGIYPLYNMHAIARDTNEMCKEDGKKTTGLLLYIIFTFITCGIYAWVWTYKLGERLSAAAYAKQVHANISGSTLLLWNLVGALLCGIGPFVAMNIIYKALNALAEDYNKKAYAAQNNAQ